MIGILFSFLAAISWGSGDFLGGFSSRKLQHFQVLFLTTFSGIIMLLVFTLIWQESLPSLRNILIALIAGISGAFGLVFLYKGLSMGNAALVAPVSAVIGAIIPTLVGLLLEGLPSVLVLLGFVLAFIGIWFVTQSKDVSGSNNKKGLGSALSAGASFGVYFVLIAQIEGNQVFAPLIFSKLSALIVALIFLRRLKLSVPKLTALPVALWSGILDAGGNVFYLLATQFTRLDIAALLSSLYPASTVLLSGIVLKEKLSVSQWIGVGICLAAIMLITAG